MAQDKAPTRQAVQAASAPQSGYDHAKAAELQKESAERIYRAVSRSGGESFLAPFENGVSTLTERVVKLFKQAGFFGFETVERLRNRNRRNKFTKHGASPYRGDFRPKK